MAVLAAGLWLVTFGCACGNFWFKISASAALLAGLSLAIDRPTEGGARFKAVDVPIGLASAALLYGVFCLGKLVSTTLFPFAQAQIGGIYGRAEGTPVWLITLLLLFVTGPAEEIFWRGFIQRRLMDGLGGRRGWLAATALYAGVHVSTLNFMLIGAAAVAGAYWGFLYWRLGRLAPIVISHSIWSAFIFTVLPV